MEKLTRKQFAKVIDYAVMHNVTLGDSAEKLFGERCNNAVLVAAARFCEAAFKSVPKKPTADMRYNAQITAELVEEVNARGVELTAADLADVYADEDGMPISSRKVGAIMRHAIQQGLVAISPEKWVIKHYAPLGFTNWAKKPEKPAAPEVTELAA